ncbi:MAG: tetratricopeptide repeat protein [Deltaproteobacteria bacterium]|nr:tetratricopeptide repeat protein [Deltaproteobacteria bacterium]
MRVGLGSWTAAFILAEALIAMTPCTAHAQSPGDKAGAETLFQEARQLITAGDVEQGCRKLAASQRLDPAIGSLLNLGDCYDKLGRTASAWASFREASDLARAAGDGPREAEAARRASELTPKLLRVRIVSSTPAPRGMVVSRDGVVVDAAMLGSAIPVDPGTHSVEAAAPGMQSWRRAFWVAKPGQTLEVTLPQLTPLPPGSGAEPGANGSMPTQRWAALVVGGAGALSIGVGAAFWLKSRSTWQDAQARCPGNVCPDARDVELEHDARAQASAASVGVGVGIVALGVGTALWFTTPVASRASRAPVGATMSIGPWGNGLMLRGQY